ncbi:hypothetical protein ASF60_16955 [Methylobacterium sp. Leaf113]|uniref:hypothetical protein n=1 Tax=Methylobacterium sp. Leaf113 TaxID=1736259 RepID=UPI0006FE8AAE|nr:hypothetical protein [Methylobacterium sp. Leaf113]KQP92369.1 hypothetical protein ASF60_16955 [Methylobacterium sp. Leaf113]
MADYYPLLARALDAMPDRSLALRQAVYERARGALIGQLRSLDPPLSEDDIDLERNALEAAILRLERDHGGVASAPPEPEPPTPEPEPFLPSPANDASDLPEASLPEASPPEPRPPQARPSQVRSSEPAPPAATLPPAPPPNLGVPLSPPAARAPEPSPEVAPSSPPEPFLPAPPPGAGSAAPDVVPPPVRIQPRKSKTPPFLGPDADAEGTEPTPGSEEASADTLVVDGNGQRQRPRIAVVGPRTGRSRLLRNVLVGSILIAVIGLIAVAAFLLRDKPADLQPIATEQQDGAQDGADSKFADRVGGDAAPAERAAPARRPASVPTAPTPAAPSQAQPDLAVTQRAVLYEENVGGGANAAPSATQGRVVWRLDTVPGEQGQPLETVVRATAEFPDAGLTLAMTLRRNLDATLPASHTIELAFTPSGPAGARHNVQDIGLLQGKDEEGARGSPVSGLPVRVRENLFLIGLSSLPNDIERNTDILLHKNWFDITLKFASGPRGIVAFEKGTAGTQVLQNAFDQWR